MQNVCLSFKNFKTDGMESLIIKITKLQKRIHFLRKELPILTVVKYLVYFNRFKLGNFEKAVSLSSFVLHIRHL